MQNNNGVAVKTLWVHGSDRVRWVLRASVLVFVGLAITACGQHEESSQRAKRAAIDKVTAQVGAHTKAMIPRLIKQPIAGFYTPDFPYSVRSTKFVKKGGNGVANAINVEFWDASNEQIFNDIKASFIAADYKVVASNKRTDGRLTARFGTAGKPSVFVSVSDLGSLNPRRPGADGIAYFSWTVAK